MNIIKLLSPEWFTQLGQDCNAHFFRFELPTYRFDNKPEPLKLDAIEDAHELSKLFGPRSVWSTVNYGADPQLDAQGFVRFDDLPGWSTPDPERVAAFLKSELCILGLSEVRALQQSSPHNLAWKGSREYGRLGLGQITSGIIVWGVLHILHLGSEEIPLCVKLFSQLPHDDSTQKIIENLRALVKA